MKAKEVWNKFKEYNSMFDLKRTGYIFKKKIFWIAMFISIVFVSYVAWRNDFDFSYKPYAKCPTLSEDSIGYKKPCINSYYMGCKEDWCFLETLEYGVEYGTPPDPFVIKGKIFIFIIFFFTFVINHLLYNKSFTFEVKI